ncbi:MAG: hypothetical protein Q8P34_04955 [Bacteroidota bacterium]|nr:hypothetical protein [Bacteroidota bacterium]
METITLKINTRSNKGRFLIGLIREMAKDGTFIEIESNVMDEIESGLKQVKKIQDGELPSRSVKQMINDK